MADFNIMNVGTEKLSEEDATHIRIVNLISLIVIFASFLYLIFYLNIKAVVPGIVNIIAILLYSATFFFTYKKKHRLAKIWIFSAYMLHMFFLTSIVFTKETGFHFYYIVVPSMAFLIADHEKYKDKIIISTFAFFLFFICEVIENTSHYVTLSPDVNRILYLSSFSVAFLGSLFVVFMFRLNIRRYYKEQRRLIEELQAALQEVKTLKGFIPICSSCKKIRDDQGYWNKIESYIQERSDAKFSHGICPECSDKLYGDQGWYIKMKQNKERKGK